MKQSRESLIEQASAALNRLNITGQQSTLPASLGVRLKNMTDEFLAKTIALIERDDWAGLKKLRTSVRVFNY